MTTIDKEIQDRVFRVIKKCTAIQDELLNPGYWQKPLTGKDYRLSATDLVYLLFELEVEFDIRISPDSLNDYRFATIEGIFDIIQELL